MTALLDIPPDLAPVQLAVTSALERVEAQIELALRSDIPVVDRLIRYVERYRGKMVRPTLVMLAGLAADTHAAHTALAPHTPHAPPPSAGAAATLTDGHVKVAAVTEMIHVATLVHDDVLDEASTRRRSSTVNALHGNETAVILGDYLFSCAYTLCSTLETNEAALLIGRTGATLCTGELLQLHHRADFSLDEDTYFEIVRRKTASLIAAACRLGAARTLALRGSSTEAPAARDLLQRLERFGEDIGVAFQIQDDLLDLTGEERVVGKNLGKDIEKGKLTLPLIHHLAAADPAQRGRSLSILADHALAGPERSGVLAAAMNDTGSIAHARRVAEDLVRRAQGALEPLPPTPAKRLLMLMAEAVVSRTF